VYVPGLGGELLPADAAGDTFKLRRLADGSRHRVLKNYFEEAELRDLLAPYALDLALRMGAHFWSARFTSRGRPPGPASAPTAR